MVGFANTHRKTQEKKVPLRKKTLIKEELQLEYDTSSKSHLQRLSSSQHLSIILRNQILTVKNYFSSKRNGSKRY